MSSSTLANYPWPSTVNAANFISVKLCLNKDDKKRGINDYKIWKKQMICLFESQDLRGFVDGQIPPPEESMDEQKLWRRTDQLITGWILGSISGTDVLDEVVVLDSSREVWLKLGNIFKADNDEIRTDEENNAAAAAAAAAVEDDEIVELIPEMPNNAARDQNNGTTGKDYNKYYLPLSRAIVRGNWKEVEKFLDKDKEAASTSISTDEETVLHVAMQAGKISNGFVRKLLESTTDDVLLRKDSDGTTALHWAALIGNTEAALMLVNRNLELLYILDDGDRLPVHLASIYCHKETLRYLISVSKKDVENSPFVGRLGGQLLGFVITSGFIDVALDLVQKYPELATSEDFDGDPPFLALANTGHVFHSGENFSWWQKWIYSCISLTLPTIKKVDDIESLSFNDEATKKFSWSQIIYKIPQVKRIKDKKVLHQQALELTKYFCRALESLPCSHFEPIYHKALLMAARNGIHELVEEIIHMFPDAIYLQTENGGNIFHVAARSRNENVFNLLNRVKDRKYFFYDNTDHSGNNYMHMCGELAPPHKLNLVSGAALQMQRELQWFKETEKFVNPSRRTWTNRSGKTPQMLFTENHEDLKSKGEKWMKGTATSCSIAAALIATVVFGAAFTIPGGVHSDSGVQSESGVPIFLKQTSFIIFAISDSISLFTSTTSLLMFLSILTSRFAEEDFLYILPKRLCVGLFILFTSIAFMMVTFCTAAYIILKDRSRLFLIPAAALGCLPVASFVFLQFPLLIDVMYLTCGPGIFGKKRVRTVY